MDRTTPPCCLIALVALAACKDTAQRPAPTEAPRDAAPTAKATEPPCAEPVATERALADPAGLALLNDLSGDLDVEVTEAPVQISPPLENRKAPATAQLRSVKLNAHVFTGDDFRDLTRDELDRVVFRGGFVELRGLGGTVRHTAPRCGRFTVRDVLRAVEETERQTRADSEWFEGIDVHHVFFEGLDLGDDGVWTIYWGS